MSEAAGRLAGVLARENAALEALDFAAAGALLAEKVAALEALTAQREPARQEVAERLAALAAANRGLLERAILVQTRVLGTIARAASRAAPEAGGYGRARYGAAERRLPPMALSARC